MSVVWNMGRSQSKQAIKETDMASTGSAEWKGDLKGGSGEFTVGEDIYTGTYSFASRFEDGEGANPEKLIAAAHASCFSMALAAALDEAGHTAESVRTRAVVTLKVGGEGPHISKIELSTEASVPGISDEDFAEQAQAAKEGCPVSKALAGVPEITLDARLT
jgi:osmotically inducible protein OsmC